MTDTPEQEQSLPPLIVNGQYIKDLSFEAPHAPNIFSELQGRQPDVPISIDLQARPLAENVYEVLLHLKIEGRLDDKVAFMIELAYGGVFTVHVPAEHLQPMLLIEAPRILFPFARAIIADATRNAGFPPLMLQPIDFVQLYRQRVAEVAAEQNGEA